MAFSALSCNIFETRDPEPPTQSSSSFQPPTEPSIVFSNMINAFRDLNSLNYLRSFSDSAATNRSYRFEPTPQAQSKYGDLFQSWTRTSEQQYFDNFRTRVPQGSVATLELSFSVQIIQSDSAQFEATYRLVIPHTQPSVAQEARGHSQFFLVVDRSRNWSIWRWVDLPLNQQDVTWSELKGAFGR
ncbi:MAG TPA: hypothetical protein VNN76_10905 [Bacteroidota bacterium]|nr:hypothetical protein [Bacteroidota bacterium]